MKRNLLYLILGVAAVLAMGQYSHVVQWTALSSPKVAWMPVGDGTITAAQATPAVNARSWATLKGLTATKTAVWNVPEDATAGEFRFSTNADGDTDTIEIWVAADENIYSNQVADLCTLGAILNLTGGKAVGPYSNFFVDTITLTAGGIFTGAEIVDSATDRMAIYRVDLRGWKRVVIIATGLQLNSTLR